MSSNSDNLKYLIRLQRGRERSELNQGLFTKTRTRLRQEIRGLQQQTGFVKPPIPLPEIARALGVRKIDDTSNVPTTGALCQESGKTCIKLDRQLTKFPDKKLIVFGHELAHLLIDRIDQGNTKNRLGYTQLERLCDYGALELLAPTDWILDLSTRPAPRGELIIHMAQACGLSEKVCAKRYTECAMEEILFAFWTVKQGTIHLTESCSLGPFSLDILRWPTAETLNQVSKAIADEHTIQGEYAGIVDKQEISYPVIHYPLSHESCMSVVEKNETLS